MEKYKNFINEVRKIRGLKTVGVEYNSTYDSIYFHFSPKQWIRIDNEKSKMWEHFTDLLVDYSYKAEFTCNYIIEVYEE